MRVEQSVVRQPEYAPIWRADQECAHPRELQYRWRRACASKRFPFGSIRIDGVTYEHDVVIDRGRVRKRKKKASRKFRDEFGHTPVSIEEDIPWKCNRLVIGTGAGALPVMDKVKREAKRRQVKLLVLPTGEAIQAVKQDPEQTNAILHVTC